MVLAEDPLLTANPLPLEPIYSMFYHRFLLLSRNEERNIRYNQTLNQIESLEAQGELFAIRPATHLKVGRFESDIAVLESLYNLGRQDGQNQINPSNLPPTNVKEIFMVKVIFVCLGNICRSPMAEAISNPWWQKPV